MKCCGESRAILFATAFILSGMNQNLLLGGAVIACAGMWIVTSSVETLLLVWLMTALWGANHAVRKATRMTEG